MNLDCESGELFRDWEEREGKVTSCCRVSQRPCIAQGSVQDLTTE